MLHVNHVTYLIIRTRAPPSEKLNLESAVAPADSLRGDSRLVAKSVHSLTLLFELQKARGLPSYYYYNYYYYYIIISYSYYSYY